MTTDQTTEATVAVDATAVIQVIQQTHPDLVRAAVWQVRAMTAEAQLASLAGTATVLTSNIADENDPEPAFDDTNPVPTEIAPSEDEPPR